MTSTGGMYQKAAGRTWYLRRIVPADVRARIGKTAWHVSLETNDDRVARQARERLWRDWSAEIAEARSLGPGPVADLPAVLAAVDNWRRTRCGAAADFAADLAEERRAFELAETRKHVDEIRRGPVFVKLDLAAPNPRDPVDGDALAWARAYFASERGQGADRGVGMPYAAGLLLDRLQAAATAGEAWSRVHGFDAQFDAALAAGGLSATVPPRVRDEARQPFARAWLEVAQHEEHERRRAASILATLAAANAVPASITMQAAPAFEARAGDVTVAEAIDEFKEARGRDGVEDIEKRYGHLFRAIAEIVGDDRPIRSITDRDAAGVLDLLRQVPANASKLYPGKKLKAAIKLAAAERQANERVIEKGETPKRKVAAMTPNTVRSYIVNGSALWNFSADRGWVERNVFQPLIPSKRPSVKRRGFKDDELTAVFAHIAERRDSHTDYFWITSVLMYSGARMNEICQLLPGDVKDADGVAYIDLTEFDENGERDASKRLKTVHSFRAVPIHPELITAGFLDFVAQRRAEGAERLFPTCDQHNPSGRYSHEFSKWFRRMRIAAGVDGKATVGHSFRHGFREHGRRAGLSDEVIDALGGWKPGSEGAAYGDRNSPETVTANAAHLAKVRLGEFLLSAHINSEPRDSVDV